MYEIPTEKSNGVTLSVPVNRSDYKEFERKIQEQLAYFENVYIDMEGFDNNFNIFRSDDFQWSEVCNDRNIHISLDNIYYPIDYTKLGISPINFPVALKFSLRDGLLPIPNREQLEYTSESKKIILDKIKKVANWFVNKYNSEVKTEYDNILECWDLIGNSSYNITIGEKSFHINPLLKYSDIILNTLKLNTVSYKTPEYYKNFRNYLNNYTILVDYEDYKWRTKNIWRNITQRLTDNRYKVILVTELPKGNLKQYLLQKYSGTNILFVKKDCSRTLGTYKYPSQTSYKTILGLDYHCSKSDWRTFITEFNTIENQFIEKLIDETNCIIPQQWLDNKKELQKLNRSKPDYIAKSLNKQEGDVTLSIARTGATSHRTTFEKKAVKISKLQTEPYLIIYSSKDEDKELFSKYYQLTKKLTNIKFVLIGKRELSKLPISHKFKSMEQFKNSKPFSRIATSLLINNLLDKYGDIYDNSGVELIKIAVKGMESDIDALREYRKNNPIEDSGSFTEELLQFAKDNNLFDQSIYYICKRVEEHIHDFTFVNLLDKPRSYDTQAKKEYTAFINQVLLWQKLYKDAHKDFKLVEIPKEEVLETTEQE